MKKLSFLISIFLFSNFVFSQNIIGTIKRNVNKHVNSEVNKQSDKALNKAENKIENIGKDKDKSDNNNNSQNTNNSTNANNEQNTTNNESNTSTNTELISSSKYDFVPGDKILFYEDFSQDAIGDFPDLWTTNSSGEVKTVNIASGNWFHMLGKDAVYCYNKDINFPENFILEFDIIPDKVYSRGIMLILYQDATPSEIESSNYPGEKGVYIQIEPDDWNTLGYNNVDANSEKFEGHSQIALVEKEKVNHIIIWIQKRRLRIYHKGQKAIDMPVNLHQGIKLNRMLFSGWDRGSLPFITNIKVTTATPDTRNKLLTEGKIVSYGIYFDSGKDLVKAESYGTLNEIAKVLNENPAVKINIVGYTDSDGDDALNLDLSKRRAANVKNSLIKDFSIDGTRIQTDGKGETSPIAPNDNPENKAKNRRVEFIKL